MLFWVAVRIETMNLGSVFVGKNETFWGFSGLCENGERVILIELLNKKFDDNCMKAKKNFMIIEVGLSRFDNDFTLIPDACFDFRESF